MHIPESQTEWTVAECGCRFGVIEDTFVIEACEAGADCPYVQIAVSYSQELNHPVSVLDLPDEAGP